MNRHGLRNEGVRNQENDQENDEEGNFEEKIRKFVNKEKRVHFFLDNRMDFC